MYTTVTSSPRQEKLFIWPPFFVAITNKQYDKRLLRQKTGGACLYLPKDGHWLASFELITPLPKRVSFSAAKKMKILHYVKTLLFLIQIFGVFCFFGENFVCCDKLSPTYLLTKSQFTHWL